MSFLNSSVTSTVFEHPVYEGYSFEDAGATLIAMESYDDSESVIESISALDILILRESELPVLEAGAKDVIERVKSAFKKLWGKLKAFFATIMRYFDAMTKSAADFAKKYEKELGTKSLSNFKYKMFNYTIPEAPDKNASSAEKVLDDITGVLSNFTLAAGADKAKEGLNKLKEDREETEEEIRAEVAGKGGKLTAEEFRKELFATFRGGAEGADDKAERDINIRTIISEVKDSPKLKRAVEAASKQTDATFNKYLKALTAAQKKVEIKDDEGHNNATAMAVLSGYVGQYQRIVTFQKTTISQFYSAWITAIKERDRTYKSVMQAAFRHNDDK